MFIAFNVFNYVVKHGGKKLHTLYIKTEKNYIVLKTLLRKLEKTEGEFGTG